MMNVRRTVTLTFLAQAACINYKPVGDADPTADETTTETSASDTTGTTSTPDTTGTSSASDVTGATSSGTTDTSTDSEGPLVECPDGPPNACIGNICSYDTCGGPWSAFDADGCPRQTCFGDDGPCPEGRTCIVPGDYGSCRPSTWTCGQEPDGYCACGGTADCSPTTGSCVPDDELPPPITSCVPTEPAPAAFALTPAPDLDPLATNCTITGIDPLTANCEEGFPEAVTLSFNTSEGPLLNVGQTMQLEYWALSGVPAEGAWLRLSSSGSTLLVAVQAQTLLPSGLTPAAFWPPNVQVELGTVAGCPDLPLPCATPEYTYAEGRAASVVFNDAPFASATSGDVPLADDIEPLFASVGYARTGPGCGPTSEAQSGWYSFVITQTLHAIGYHGPVCTEEGQPIVRSRNCALLAERLSFTFEECQACQGMACDSVPGCSAPCVDGVHVYQGCCNDDDCAGVSTFCSSFASGPHNTCVDEDPV